jgi:hypothetical protein
MGEYSALEPWKIDKFYLEAGPSGTYDELFANGLMQDRVTISIEAYKHDPETGDNVPYTFIGFEWMLFELQLTGDRPLPPEWHVSYVENDLYTRCPRSVESHTRGIYLPGKLETTSTKAKANQT